MADIVAWGRLRVKLSYRLRPLPTTADHSMNSSKYFALILLSVSSGVQAGGGYDCIIEPTQTVEVRSSVVGVLERVQVRRGDRISKGQVLANIESGAERASVELARFKSEMAGPVSIAENKLEFANRKFKRRRDMNEMNFMAAQERDDAEGEMRLAESELQLAKENRQMARLEFEQQNSLLELRTIRSPFDGVVSDQMLYPGEVVEPNDPKKPILRIAQINPLQVHVILPIALFGKIKHGVQASIFPEQPVNGRYQATVKIVDRLVDAASGTFGVFLELQNSKLDVPSGIKCRAEFSYEAASRPKSH
ncbi:MAG: secretion protein HlyD [Gallionellaceae bacterium]|nr:MAG: secretion protein HlyD [Gallionellaceae bacterium]